MQPEQSASKDWIQLDQLAEDMGEDPGRYLDGPLDPHPRIRGLESVAMVRAWKGAERRIANIRQREPSQRIMQALDARETVRVPVHLDNPDGGYDRVDMPMCRRCRLQRHGHPCDHCGELHRTIEAASKCCVGSTKAPDCIECGRRMAVGAKGFDPVRGEDITWADCECCPVGWGRFTGWVHTDGEPCKHVDSDPRGETA